MVCSHVMVSTNMAFNHIRDDASTKQSSIKRDFTVNLILVFILEVLGGEISPQNSQIPHKMLK